MTHSPEDTVWLVPLFLTSLFMLATAPMWWRVANGKKVHGVDLQPSERDLKMAASSSAISFALLAVSILAFFWVRF